MVTIIPTKFQVHTKVNTLSCKTSDDPWMTSDDPENFPHQVPLAFDISFSSKCVTLKMNK